MVRRMLTAVACAGCALSQASCISNDTLRGIGVRALQQTTVPAALLVVRGDEFAIVADAGCLEFEPAPAGSEDLRAVLKWNEPATPAAEIEYRPLSQLETVLAAGELERGLVLIGSVGEMMPEQFQEIRAALVGYGLIVLQDAPPAGEATAQKAS